MLRFRNAWFAAGLLMVMGSAAVAAQDLRGAAAVLAALPKSNGAEPPMTVAPAMVLEADLGALRKRLAALPPKEAAQEWLVYVEDWLKRPVPAKSDPARIVFPVQFTALISLLPAPEAWAELTAAIEARRPPGGRPNSSDLALSLLAHTLQGNREAQRRDLRLLEGTTFPGTIEERKFRVQQIQELRNYLDKASGDPEFSLGAIRRHASLPGNGGPNRLNLPDLVTLVGHNRAEAVLRDLLSNGRAELFIPEGKTTQRIAQKIAAQDVYKLKVAQWALAHDLNAAPLYEALEKRFITSPAQSSRTKRGRQQVAPFSSNGSHGLAAAYYLFGLIARQQTQKASARFPVLVRYFDYFFESEELIRPLEGVGGVSAVCTFLGTRVGSTDSRGLWDLYLQLLKSAGTADAALPVLRAALTRPAFSKEHRLELAGHLYHAHLAADQVEEAVQVISWYFGSPVDTDPRSLVLRQEAGSTLAELGLLLGRKELVREGIRVLRAAMRGVSGVDPFSAPNHARLLLDAGEPLAAEAELARELSKFAGARVANNPRNSSHVVLTALAAVYHETGRSSDVITLLQQSLDWQAFDLQDLLLSRDPRARPLGYLVASALAAKGQHDVARSILEEILLTQPDEDPAYELLIQLQGTKALPFLEALHIRDPQADRPLLWKAQLLLEGGRFAEAASVVRMAIALNPSEDARLPGRRERPYTLLAQLSAKKGNAPGKAQFERIVAGIRMGERADRFHKVGLITQAIAGYRKALTDFPDDYTLHARLALALAERGRFAEATPHYRRAFELLPEHQSQFGGFCFECLPLFTGKRAQDLAHVTFVGEILRTPDNPRGHRLLGYLREHQGRGGEALKHYQDALKRDPDDFNSWRQIHTLGRPIGEERAPWLVSPALRDQALLRLIQLDPLGRRSRRELQQAEDLRGLWSVMQGAARDNEPALRAEIYPLSAMRTAPEYAERALWSVNTTMVDLMRVLSYETPANLYFQRSPIPRPAQVIAANRVLSLAAQLLDQTRAAR